MRLPLLVYVLATGAFTLITTEFGIIGILPTLADAFDVTIDQAGWLLSGFALTIALVGPWMTLLFARVNRKTCLVVVLALFAISNIVSVYAMNFAVLMVARIVPALFHPVFWSVAMSLAAKSVQPEDGPKAVSIVFAGLSAGTVLGVPLASLFSDTNGWPAAFIVFAILNFIALAAHLLFVRSAPVDKPLSFGQQVKVLRKPSVWWALSLQVLLVAAAFATYSFMAEYLQVAAAMDGQQVALMLLLFGAAGFSGTLFTGWLISRSLSLSVWCYVVALAVVLLALSQSGFSQVLTAVVVIVWGFVHSAGFLLGQTLIARSAPEAPEFSNSLFASFGNVGLTFGTYVGGSSIAVAGVHSIPFTSVGLLVVCGLVFFIGRLLQPAATISSKAKEQMS